MAFGYYPNLADLGYRVNPPVTDPLPAVTLALPAIRGMGQRPTYISTNLRLLAGLLLAGYRDVCGGRR